MSFYSMHNQRVGQRSLGVKGDWVRIKINTLNTTLYTLNEQSASTVIEIYTVICGPFWTRSIPVNCNLAGSIRPLIGMQALFFTAEQGTR